jgi:uncharacterized small protein (DUF1192 family)
MAQVKVEFVLKGGDKVVTTNETIIKQLVEQGAQYKVLEGDINSLIAAQDEQVESTQELTKSYKEVLAEYKANEKELKALAIAGDTTSARYQELSASVGAARAALEDVNKEANINKGAFDATIGSLGGAAAGFSAFQGALGLIGAESENVQKALLKVQSALALSQGLDQFQKSIPAFKNLAGLIKGPVVASFTTLKGAIAATGIGLIAIAVGILIANWDKLVDALRTAFPAFAVIEKFFDNFKNIAFGVVAGVVEAFKVLGDVVGNIFKGNFSQAVAEAKNFGTRVGAAYQQGVNKAIEDEARAGRIAQLEEDIAFAEARGQETLAIEKKLIQERIAAAQEGSKELRELKIEEARIDTQITKKREEDAKTAEERITAIRKANAERRIALLNDGLTKELALLKLNYEEQRKEALKNGENVKLVDQLYNKQRTELVDRFAKEYVAKVNEIYTRLNAITTGSYLVEEAALRRNQDEQKRLLQGQISNLRAILKERETVLTTNTEAEQNIRKRDLQNIQTQITQQQALVTKLNKDFNEEYEKLLRFEVLPIDVENAKKLYEKAAQELQKLREKSTTVQTRVITDVEIKAEQAKNNVISEERKRSYDDALIDLNQFLLVQQSQEELFVAELGALRAEKLASGLKAEIDLREQAGEDVLQKQLQLFDEEFKLFTDNEKRKVRQRAEIQALAAGADIDVARAAGEAAVAEYEKLIGVVADAAKARITFSNQVTALEKQQTKESLDAQIKYYAELNGISNTNTRKRKQEEADISRKFEQQELDRQRKLLDQKLAAAKKAFGEESEEYKKLQLEKAKLEKKATDDSIKDQEKRLGAFIAVFQQFLSTLAEIGAAIDSFYELQAARTNAFYDEEVRKNTEANNNEINNYALTEEEKQNINQRYALQEAEIERKRAEDIKKIEKKRADTAFAFQIAQIIGNGALAVVRALAELGPIAGPIAAILVGATVAAQLLVANNQRKIAQQLEDGGVLSGASHSQGGIPVGNTGITVEGGEAVINKKSTSKYLPMLDMINRAEGGAPLMPRTTSFMQTGGMMMAGQMSGGGSTVMKTYVVSDEVTNKQAMEARIKRQSQF